MPEGFLLEESKLWAWGPKSPTESMEPMTGQQIMGLGTKVPQWGP